MYILLICVDDLHFITRDDDDDDDDDEITQGF